jgi:hypothetical protein
MNTNSVIKQNDSLGRLIVGLLLLIYLSVSVGVLRSRLLMTFTALETDVIGIEPNQVNQAIIMLLAGALGSLVYEIRAYYIHACEKKDFNRAHIPWYVLWFFQGALLGLIFYFVVRGGLLLITISGNDQSQADLNTWSLAAIGSLVGLFSKYALAKLRQVFIIIFTSKDDLDLDEMERKSEKRILEETLKLDEEYKIKIHGSDLQTELFQKQQKERQAEIDLKKKDDELQEINP